MARHGQYGKAIPIQTHTTMCGKKIEKGHDGTYMADHKHKHHRPGMNHDGITHDDGITGYTLMANG